MKQILQYIIIAILIGSTALCIFPADIAVAKWLTERAVLIVFGLLGFGLLGLLLSQPKVMYTGLLCAAALSIFLKGESNGSIVFPSKNNLPSFEILHLNLSALNDEYEATFDQILDYNADFLSFQEVTPEWNAYLKSVLKAKYPYDATIVKIDPFGKAIYSKVPILDVDTLNNKERPILVVSTSIKSNKLKIASSYISQAIDNQGKTQAKATLNTLSDMVNNSKTPTLVVGDFNLVYWDNEIREFRSESKLNNSRRTISLSSFHIPYDHIFYNNRVECTFFEEINSGQNHIGIIGDYQLTPSN